MTKSQHNLFLKNMNKDVQFDENINGPKDNKFEIEQLIEEEVLEESILDSKDKLPTMFENILEKRREDKITSDPKYENFNEDLGIDDLIDKKFILLDRPLRRIKNKYF